MFVLPRILLINATRISRLQLRKLHNLTADTSTRLYNIKTVPVSRFNSTTSANPRHEVDFEDVVGSLNKPKTIIIDVRNPDEVQSTGQIPSSINIPLDNLQRVLTNMSEEEFKKYYHRSKPSQADELIFYCKSGKRASKALETALTLGYSESKKYLGSWNEWSSRQK